MKREILHIDKNILKLFKTSEEIEFKPILKSCANCSNKGSLNANCIKSCQNKLVHLELLLDNKNLVIKHKLTKSEKIVYLAYLSKICKTSNVEVGYTIAITNIEIARICNIDATTVSIAKRNLEKIGFIEVQDLEDGKHRVKIVGYDALHLTKDEGGHGYVKLSYNLFKALCKLNANELRVAFDLILAIDNVKGNKYIKTDKVNKNFKQIRKFLPSYINCKKKVKEIFDKLEGLFDIHNTEDGFKCKHLNMYIVENHLATLGKGNRKLIKKLAKNNNVKYTIKDLDDMVKMSFEYGITAISNALMYIVRAGISEIENLGGLIRVLIKNSILYNTYDFNI